MGASISGLTEITNSDPFIPAICCTAPLIPKAKYNERM